MMLFSAGRAVDNRVFSQQDQIADRRRAVLVLTVAAAVLEQEGIAGLNFAQLCWG